MNESDQAGRSRDLLSAPHVGVARGARLQHPITPTSAMMSNAIGLIFLVCTQPVCCPEREMSAMFSAIWGVGRCEAKCPQFGCKFVLRICMQNMYKIAVA